MTTHAETGGLITLDEYQQRASETVRYRTTIEGEEAQKTYALLKLASKAGALNNFWAIYLRDGDYDVNELMNSVGEVLRYAANLAQDFGFTLNQVAYLNMGEWLDPAHEQ